MKTNSNGVTSTTTDRATAEAVDRRYHRQVLAERAGRQQTPGERRPRLAVAPSERKQSGRKFGPPPKEPPHPRMQAPAPMTTGRRFTVYHNATDVVTDRQHRQLYRMGMRHDDLWSSRRADAKSGPTPTRREASR